MWSKNSTFPFAKLIIERSFKPATLIRGLSLFRFPFNWVHFGVLWHSYHLTCRVGDAICYYLLKTLHICSMQDFFDRYMICLGYLKDPSETSLLGITLPRWMARFHWHFNVGSTVRLKLAELLVRISSILRSRRISFT